jgi:hypothetical protein
LDSYKFATCKSFFDIEAGVKHLATRTCKNIILISGGFICTQDFGPQTNLLAKIAAGPPMIKKKILDHVIFCVDDKKYKPIQKANKYSKGDGYLCVENDELDGVLLKIIKAREA